MSKGIAGFKGHLATMVLFIGVCAAWVGFILDQSGVLQPFGTKYTVTAIVPTSGLLVAGSRVTVAGVDVGKVKSIQRADSLGLNARVKLTITDKRVTPLPDDSRVEVRTRSQVGENYVSVDVGHSHQTLADGGELGVEEANVTVPVDEILSIFRGRTRDNVRTLLQRFGGALSGRGTELNHTLAAFNRLTRSGGDLVAALDANRRQTGLIVDHFGRLMTDAGASGAAIDQLARRGVIAARAVADRDARLRATLRQLPSTLRSLRGASKTIGDVSDGSAPVLENLATAVRALEPAVSDFAPAAKAGLRLVQSITPAQGPLGRTLTQVARLGADAPSVYPGFQKTLCQVNPMLRYIGPYSKDVFTVVYGLGSTSNSYDATGHLIRLLPLVNESSLSGAPPGVLKAEKTLLQSGAFLKSKSISYNAYMKPGLVGREVARSDGTPANAAAQTAAGYKYPRVKADC